jgi:hypothetical protein
MAKKYPVLSPIRHDGKDYVVGSSIDAALVDDALRASGAVDVSAGEDDASEEPRKPRQK